MPTEYLTRWAQQKRLTAYGFQERTPTRQTQMEIPTETYARKDDYTTPRGVNVVEIEEGKSQWGKTAKLKLDDDTVVECFPGDLKKIAKKYGKETAAWKMPLSVTLSAVDTGKGNKKWVLQ